MLKLIAESGSTKTSWRIIENNEIFSLETLGINPLFVTHEWVHSILDNTILKNYKTRPMEIFFYGASCSTPSKKDFIRDIFSTYFQHAGAIAIDHDMMAACVALFGAGSGIACILGTGSNSCVYTSHVIQKNIPAQGFILGDEASGAFFGKELLSQYIYKSLPEKIIDYMTQTYTISEEIIYENVYSMPLPNRFVASFAPVLSVFREEKWIQNMLADGFDLFIRRHILPYPEHRDMPIAFVGSIAVQFQYELSSAMAKYELEINHIDPSPIERLVLYHQSI
jgi:glucosamine kinase